MQIKLLGHHVEITPALRTLTEEKFQRLGHKFDLISMAQITFSIENLTHIIDADLLLGNDKVHARSQSDDMYRNIDDVLDKLEPQLKKHKDKLKSHRDV